MVKLLIEAGANLDIQDNGGNTALIGASYNNRPEVVKLLIESGANIDVQNNSGCTALILASYRNHIEVVKLLIEHFADEFIIDNDGKSFYDYLNKENKKVIKELYPNEVESALIASGN